MCVVRRPREFGYDARRTTHGEEDGARAAADGRYDSTTIWLHWSMVGLIAILWVMGQTADLLPRGPIRTGAWSVHVLLGLVTGLVLVLRIVWRAGFGRALPPADTGVLHAVAVVTHYALYVLVAAVVVLGVLDALYRGFVLFDLWPLPQIGTGDASVRRSIHGWHELAANLTAAVALLHAAAALVHHYVWRDRLLDRMAP
jgi:cytochrome b561